MAASTLGLLVQRYLPVIGWCRQYSAKRQLLRDIVSGATVGLMTVPQALSYAAVAGLPAERGLYSSLVAMILYALLGTSPHLICGPTAVMAIMVRSSIPEEWQDVELHPADALYPGASGGGNSTLALRALAQEGPHDTPHAFAVGQQAYIDAASMLTFFAGMLQLLIGAGGAGFVFQLISAPVVAGFTSAAALLIVSTQLNTALGLSKCTTSTDSRCSFFQNLAHVLGGLPNAKGGVVAGTAACLVVLLVFKHALRPRLRGAWKPLGNLGPMVILAVFTPLFYVHQAVMEGAGIRAVGHVPAGLPAPEAPFRAPAAWQDESDGQRFLSADAVLALLPGALGMAAVGFLEANAISRVVARRTGTGTPAAATELRALGLANCGTACFRGFAVTGSFSRTAVNVDAGASSGVSGAVAAVVVALACLLLTPVLAYLPMVCLAAIILSAVGNLLEVKEAAAYFRTSAREFTVFCVVFLCVLAVGVEAGLAVGIMCSWALTLSSQQWEHTPGVLLVRSREGSGWQDAAEARNAEHVRSADKVLVLAVHGDISFAGADALAAAVQEGVGVFKPTVVVLDVTASNRCDTSGVTALHSLVESLRAEGGVHVFLGGLKTALAADLARVLAVHLPAGSKAWAAQSDAQCTKAGVQPVLVQHGLLALPTVRSALAVAAVAGKALTAPPAANEHSVVPPDALLSKHWAACRAAWLASIDSNAPLQFASPGALQAAGGAAAVPPQSPRGRGPFGEAGPPTPTVPSAGCPQVIRRVLRQTHAAFAACGCSAPAQSPAAQGLLTGGPSHRQRAHPSSLVRQEDEGPDDCLVHLRVAPMHWLGSALSAHGGV